MTNLSHLQVEDTDWVIPFWHYCWQKIAKEIPLVLLQLVQNGQVNLDMEDHQDQEYIQPRIRFKAFINTPSSPEEKSILNAVVPVDDSVPMTKIPIRILDVPDFIVQSHPESATLDFILGLHFHRAH
eukprot:bmy_13394T0